MIEARQLIKQENFFEKSLEEIQDNVIPPSFNYKENQSETSSQTFIPTKQNHRGKEATSLSVLQEGLEYWQKHLKLGSEPKGESEKLTPARLAPPH